MTTDQEKTVQGLRTAIQMEIDGKQFYLKASQESGNEAGKKLLKQLAAEEDIHRQKFEQIYESIRASNAWPSVEYQPDGGRGLRTLFARATQHLGSNVKALNTELAAAQTAVDMEARTFDFYKKQSRETAYAAAREFFEAVAAQEREHQLILLDYYEFLKNPAAWFVDKEHPSLDGA
jgi:rubrerythrin